MSYRHTRQKHNKHSISWGYKGIVLFADKVVILETDLQNENENIQHQTTHYYIQYSNQDYYYALLHTFIMVLNSPDAPFSVMTRSGLTAMISEHIFWMASSSSSNSLAKSISPLISTAVWSTQTHFLFRSSSYSPDSLPSCTQVDSPVVQYGDFQCAASYGDV